VGFWFESGNTTTVSAKGLWCCVYEKKRLSGLYPFRGRLLGDRFARSLALRARQFSDYLFASVLAYRSTPRVRSSGGLTEGYAPSQFIPFDPFLSGGIYCSAAAHFLYGVPAERSLWGVPTPSGRYPYLPGEREELIVGRRLQLSHGVAGKICSVSRQPSLHCGKHCGVLP
jgi:hypothetical protein